jgi:hypothetical protein
VRWVDLTEDLRVRTRPETVLAVFGRLAAGGAIGARKSSNLAQKENR